MNENLDTNKGPDDFPNKQDFLDYCVEVALYLYNIFIENDKNIKKDETNDN